MKLGFGSILLFFVVLSLGLYLGNPSGTASMDPRARMFGFLLFTIPSVSNTPTLQPGDVVLVSTFAYWGDPVQRGDMLVFIPPHDPRPFVKRVVAIGGDQLSMVGTVVMLNGRALEEPYVSTDNNILPSTFGEMTIPANMLFVMGDNRDRSQDSRSFGLVERSGVLGRVGLVL